MNTVLRRATIPGAIGAGLAVMIMATGTVWIANRDAISGLPSNVKFGSVSADPISGRVHINNIVVQLSDATLRVGSLSYNGRVALISPALAAESFSLKSVSVDNGATYYRASAIDVAGSSLSQKDFAALLDKSAKKSLPDFLAGFSAESVTMPDAASEQTVAGGKRVITLRNTVLRSIASGKAASLNVTDGTLKGPPPVDASFGAIEGKAVDLVQVARLLGDPPATPDAAPKPLYSSLSLDKLAFKIANGGGAVGKITSNDIKIQLGNQPNRILPAMGTFKIADAAVDVPSTKVKGEILKWSLKGLTLSADAPRENIPTVFKVSVDNIAVVVPPDTKDPGFKTINELGYSAISLSTVLDGNWNPQNKEFNFKEASLSGADIGSIALTGSFGNISKDVFSKDKAVSQPAMKSAMLKSIGLVVENKGFYEHVVAKEAKKRGKSLDDTRKELGAAAAVTFSAMTASVVDGKVVVDAVSKFLAKPGKLKVNVKSKDPAGVLWSSFTDPALREAAAAKVDVTASAE